MRETYVYFLRPIGAMGPVKVGCSMMPRGRLTALTVYSPMPLELVVAIPGDAALERNLHECFLDSHIHREWFDITPRLQACIEALQAGKPIHKAVDLSKRLGVLTETRKPKRMTSPAQQEKLAFDRERRRVAPKDSAYWPLDIDRLMITQERHTPLTDAQRARIRYVLAHPELFLTLDQFISNSQPQTQARAA